MKKIIFLVLISIVLFSCKNMEVVQNENTVNFQIKEKLSKWELKEAENLINELEEAEKSTYLQELNEKKAKLQELYSVENIVKEAFFYGDYSYLDNHVRLGTIDNYKYGKIKEYGLKDVKVYIGNRDFLDDKLTEVAVMNLYEESIYFELGLQYEDNDWFIKSFNEKR